MKRLLLFLLLIPALLRAQLHVYPIGNSSKLSDRYYCSVASTNSPVYESAAGSCTSGQCGGNAGSLFNFTIFSIGSSQTVTVTKITSSATTAIIRPSNTTISTTSSGGNVSVTFTVSQPGKYSVEFSDDGSLTNVMVILAQPLETNVPDTTKSYCLKVTSSASLASIPSKDSVIYFPYGTVSFDKWIVPSTVKHIYIVGGAYLEGYIYASAGVLINGRGVLSATGYPYHYGGTSFSQWYRLINISGGVNKIYGITLIEASGPNIYFANGSNTIVDGVNINGFFFNNDGITLSGSGTVLVQNCFIRNEDDGIIPYQNNVTINNCTFWQLNSSSIQLGFQPHSLSNFLIENCTVLHAKFTTANNNGGFITSMNTTENVVPAVITNFTINNITFCTPVTYFMNIRGDRAGQTTSTSPWVYTNWTISNITLLGSGTMLYMHGYSACFPSFYPGGISFSNFTLNGSAAPLSDPTFFSTANYNIAPCSSPGPIHKINVRRTIKNIYSL